MVKIVLIPVKEFQRVREATIDKYHKLALLADMCRANALASVKCAGSGHLGSSFSSLDIVTMLYYSEMNTADLGIDHPDRDIYFSSMGHDVPGLYAILFSLGILSRERLVGLRRLGGTFGHPDVSIPGIEANSGSLGMGISKAKGMAFAKRLRGHGGRVFVMTGDGELQEGQIYEALQSAVQQRLTNLHVIVDHNKVQSDKPVAEITDLGDLEGRYRAFGWQVARCDGHDFERLDGVFAAFASITDRPKVLIADTIKGKGVSFMEHPAALKAGGGLYGWHFGAPDDQSFCDGYEEIVTRIDRGLSQTGAISTDPGAGPLCDRGPFAGGRAGGFAVERPDGRRTTGRTAPDKARGGGPSGLRHACPGAQVPRPGWGFPGPANRPPRREGGRICAAPVSIACTSSLLETGVLAPGFAGIWPFRLASRGAVA